MIKPFWLTLWLVFVLIGCVGKEVLTELPPNHPANPKAAESIFTPPPNPFLTKVSSQPPQTKDSSMLPGDHPVGKQMHHDLGHKTITKPSAGSAAPPADKSSEHQHREHQQ